jgi:hypothetical protein
LRIVTVTTVFAGTVNGVEAMYAGQFSAGPPGLAGMMSSATCRVVAEAAKATGEVGPLILRANEWSKMAGRTTITAMTIATTSEIRIMRALSVGV